MDSTSDQTAGYDVTEQVGHLLRKAYQKHLSIFNELSADSLLTSVQFVTLCVLRDNGDSSQAELVRATAIDQATIRGIVERLKARGLVELKKDSDDGRKVMISLTAEGGALLNSTIPKAYSISEATVKNLNDAERVALTYLLKKLLV